VRYGPHPYGQFHLNVIPKCNNIQDEERTILVQIHLNCHDGFKRRIRQLKEESGQQAIASNNKHFDK
jgi:hypothetical protein